MSLQSKGPVRSLQAWLKTGEMHELIARQNWPDAEVEFKQGMYEGVHVARAQHGEVDVASTAAAW